MMPRMVEQVTRRVICRIFQTMPDYYAGLLEKADAYGLTLFEYVKRRVAARIGRRN